MQPRLTRFMSRATSAVCGITMLTPLCGGISGLVTALSYGGPGIAVWGWCACRRARSDVTTGCQPGGLTWSSAARRLAPASHAASAPARRFAVAFFTIMVALGMAEVRRTRKPRSPPGGHRLVAARCVSRCDWPVPAAVRVCLSDRWWHVPLGCVPAAARRTPAAPAAAAAARGGLGWAAGAGEEEAAPPPTGRAERPVGRRESLTAAFHM